jgi:hypothetical protein
MSNPKNWYSITNKSDKLPTHHVERGISIGDEVCESIVIGRSGHKSEFGLERCEIA